MQFLFPNILYALFLALIPIILHLINLRKHKKMYFSSLWFLKNLKQQTSRSKKLYEWLLLLIRTILIAAIVTAFAGPYLQNDNIQGNKNLHLILDNTYSMQNSNNKGNLYDQVKNKALEIITNLDANSNVNLHFLANRKSFFNTNLSKAQNIVQNSKLRHGNYTINELIKTIKDKSKKNHIVILSDFQTNIVTPDTIFNDSLLRTSLVVYKGENTNVSIDSIWFNKPVHIPNEETEISIQLKNHSSKEVSEIPVQLFVNNELSSVGSENIDGTATRVFKTKLQFTQTGFIKIKATTQDLPLNFDNHYYTGIYLNPKYYMLEIADTASKYIRALFNEKDRFNLKSKPANRVNLSDIQNASTIIINLSQQISSGIAAAINKAVTNGANLIIIPDMKLPVNSINEQLTSLNSPEFSELIREKTELKQLNTNHPVYKEAIFEVEENTRFPEIKKYFKINKYEGFTPLMFNDFNEPMLLQTQIGNGNLYLFTFNPLTKSFALDPIFIPTMYNASVITNRNIIPHLQSTHAGTFKAGNSDNPDQNPIYIGSGNKAFIPFYYTNQQSTVISVRKNQITEPGYYPVMRQDTSINYLAVNHLKNESKLNFHEERFLEQQIFKSASGTIFSAESGSETILQPMQKLWKWFVLLALLMVVLESLLLLIKKRVKKHN